MEGTATAPVQTLQAEAPGTLLAAMPAQQLQTANGPRCGGEALPAAVGPNPIPPVSLRGEAHLSGRVGAPYRPRVELCHSWDPTVRHAPGLSWGLTSALPREPTVPAAH